MAVLAAAPQPRTPNPADRRALGVGWAREVGPAGYRVRLGVVAGRVRLLSEGGRDRTARFPDLAREAAALPDCRLEGEMAALDEHGRADFAALLSALSGRRTSGLVLLASDLLALAGEDLRHLPRARRRLRLEGLLERCDGPAFDHLCIVETHADRLTRRLRRTRAHSSWSPVEGNANAA